MNLPLIVLPQAAASLEALAQQAGQYSATSRMQLLVVVADKLRLIEQQPEMYPVAPAFAPVRRCVVTRNVSLYYRTGPEAVIVLDIIDSRRDPSGLGLAG